MQIFDLVNAATSSATEGFLSYLGHFQMHWHHHASDFLECRSPFSLSQDAVNRLGNRGDRVSDSSLQKLRFSALCGPN